jgi:hypothetical protein
LAGFLAVVALVALGAAGLVLAIYRIQHSYQYFIDTVVAKQTTLLRIGTNIQRLSTGEYQFLESLDTSIQERCQETSDETNQLIDRYAGYEAAIAETAEPDSTEQLRRIQRLRG